MGITQLPSIADQLAPYIDQFGKALQEKFAPNKEFQKMMRDAIGKNPDLIIKLADIDARNPGFLQRVGFGKLGENIAGVGESAQGELERTTKPQQIAAGKAGLAAKTATAELTADQAQAAMEYRRTHPEATQAEAEATVKAPVTKERIAEFQLEREKKRQSLIVQRPEGPVDFVAQARKILGGTADNITLSYLNDPTTSEAMGEAITYVRQTEEIAARKAAASSAKKDTIQERIDARHDQNAYGSYIKSGMAGDIDAWKGFMYDPQVQQRALDLKSGKITPTGLADQNLLEVVDAAEKVGLSRFNNNILSAQASITTSMKLITKDLPAEQRVQQISSINTQLETMHKLNPRFPKVHAEWEDRSFANQGLVGAFTSDRLVFKDDKGNIVDTSKVEEGLSNPATTPGLSLQAQQVMQRISTVTDSATMQAAIARMQADDTSPGKTVSAEVLAELRRMGAIK